MMATDVIYSSKACFDHRSSNVAESYSRENITSTQSLRVSIEVYFPVGFPMAANDSRRVCMVLDTSRVSQGLPFWNTHS